MVHVSDDAEVADAGEAGHRVQTRVSRARSPSAGRTLNVAALEEPEGDAPKDEGVYREDDERVGLVGQGPAGQAARTADPSRDVPDEEEIGDVLEPAEEAREERGG